MLQAWYVYLLRCADNSLYCGVTTDLSRRVIEHNQSPTRGAKYTRVRRPVELVYSESQASRSLACQREYAIKQLSKQQKEALVVTSPKST
ncbi:GIY-YIG nuclease family protein [Thalassotalea euphylliae]|uniref:GIY-YIG nuclease family protein n=1 Tax=Thalassotalea euphylliae TaxID=1655234 RepID=A0A3E0TWM9_9GAMM|nr:GIY-YIG nuclease family protein [Thalassotalea euphylliae]REL28342.1 GIY-YIG nuclease family protein [Thalassotalea euphylliae]